MLEDDDARWELFGLNIPADPHAPEGVSALNVTAAGLEYTQKGLTTGSTIEADLWADERRRAAACESHGDEGDGRVRGLLP